MSQVFDHAHDEKACPVTGHHGWCPPRQGDSRSVCPALNAMANHGYIPRDGRNLTFWTVIKGVHECYGLSYFFAGFLTIVSYIALGFFWKLNLVDLDRHGRVEHNASMVHEDTPAGQHYAPTKISMKLVGDMVGDIRPAVPPELTANPQILVDEFDAARMRVRRDKTSPPLNKIHDEIARGEMALILHIWEQNWSESTFSKTRGAPLPWILDWFGNERLPEGWRPTRETGILDAMRKSKAIKQEVANIKAKSASKVVNHI
ncbi:Cloroperoxidase [Cylindrobasidium torrendii FP15055 ss-10]|uniref:Cloroperoxidase n=1 Tax=Cylindrobasidium torrendii FP15055 ss-10 TaxID=1314674 RepID=A0A0D7BQS3_9AGAR|nr:Cloroperoxidase [Cylindrobasidium torrendii FP15055 ss-10]